MIDTRTVDNIRYQLEEAARDYSRAKNENNRLAILIGRTALESTEDLSNRMDQYREQYEENTFIMKYAKEQFDTAKLNLISMVEQITLPE